MLNPHGEFESALNQQLLQFSGRGPWNDVTMRNGTVKMGRHIASITDGKPWAQLSCLYGESLAFKTSLPEPQLQTCQVQQADKKFICNPTPPSISGSVVISEVSARLDLVTGRTRRPFEPDVLFDQYQNGLLRVIPRRRATIKMRRVRRYGCTGRIPGNLEINLRANSSRGSLLRRRDYERSIFCVTTNEGRVSEFIITHPNPNSSNLEISYKTW